MKPADNTLSLKIATGKTSSTWTSYDAKWEFTCNSNEAIIGIQSQHSDDREDRKWKFTCGKLPAPLFGLADCGWTGYVNNYDYDMTFECPNNGVITGLVFSERSRTPNLGILHLMKRFNVRIQFLSNIFPSNSPCHFSHCSGIWSKHDNHHEDRIWKFNCCQVAKYTLSDPKGHWQLINDCAGCYNGYGGDAFKLSVSEGVEWSSTQEMQESYSQSLQQTFSVGYEYSFPGSSDKINIGYERSSSSSTTKRHLMSSTYSRTITTEKTNYCPKFRYKNQ